jgi:hypothetical protein
MYHLTQQEDALAGIVLYSAESDFYGVLHPIAKPEMTGQQYAQASGLQQGRGKIFFEAVAFFPFLFYRGYQRTSVVIGYVE